jgi:hypothetical protein
LHLVGVPYLPTYIDDARSNTNQAVSILSAPQLRVKIHGVLQFKEVNLQFCDNDMCITILSVQISIKTQSTLIFSVILYFAYTFFSAPLKE